MNTPTATQATATAARAAVAGPQARRRRALTWMVMPALLIYAVGMLLPIALGFVFSLTDWTGLTEDWNFVGFANYGALLDDERFFSSLWFTLKFAAANTVLQNVIALGLALLLNQQLRGTVFTRTVVFAPCLISAIIVGIVWSQLFGSILNDLLRAVGIEDLETGLLSDPDTVLAGLLIINNWQWAGYWMLIYLAALQAVPTDVLEAAYMEGAGPVRRFVSITLPLIAPAITVNLVSIVLGGFQVYELIVTATGGGPGNSSESFIMYVYNVAFARQQAGLASANSMAYVLLLMLVASVQIWVLRRREVQA